VKRSADQADRKRSNAKPNQKRIANWPALQQQKPNALSLLGFEPFRPEASEHYTFNANKFSTFAIQVSTEAWP
jgi:hypothetical protein